MNNQSRSSAWLILKWLQELYVEAVLIENVHEFEDWGPLGADGRPLKSMRGVLFDQFIASLKALGYNVEWRVLNAANYGGATTRERLFIMARRGRNKRIIWPDASHSKTGNVQSEMFSDRKPWRPAREIIDWTIPSRSIFTRKKPLVPATLERIAAGLRKFGGAAAEPFLVVLRQHMAARSLNDPLPTLTAGGQHIGLCQPFVLGQQSGAAPRHVDQPVPTIAGGGAISLVTPFIAELRGGKDAASLSQPLSTVTTKGAHHALVEPFVLSMEHGGRPFIVPVNHGLTAGCGHRVYDIDKPMPTITTVDAWGVVQPFIVPQFGERDGQQPRSHSIDAPLPTCTGHGAGALVQPFVISAGGPEGQGRNGRSVDEPMSTVLTYDHHGLVEPFLVSYYDTLNLSSVAHPVPTITTRDRFGLVQCDGYAIDIHFRMLHWRELAAAMSFPDGYQFAGNREQIVKQIGNAVEVRTATALALSALAA